MAKTQQKPKSGTSEMGANDYELKVNKITLKLTNQHKIYWPEEGYTKGQMVTYYREISSVMLPYLKDRPQSMHRFPNGIMKPGFFQKDVDTKTIPSWLHTEQIYSDSNEANIDYLICNDAETLVYMANLGCIEINPWNSRYQTAESPDWFVIDLDPESIDFREVVKVALAVREALESLEIESYCKTSGGRGLHIYVPLAARYDYETAKNFAHLVAQKINAKLPDITSLVRSPKMRQKRVYLDFLQNNKAQTLAAPYSIRPKPGATVSTPLQWAEVNSRMTPAQFTMINTMRRIDKVGDLWKPVMGKAANLKKALGKIREF
jgi:bifunctional non-homologous end joining protein LigD